MVAKGCREVACEKWLLLAVFFSLTRATTIFFPFQRVCAIVHWRHRSCDAMKSGCKMSTSGKMFGVPSSQQQTQNALLNFHPKTGWRSCYKQLSIEFQSPIAFSATPLLQLIFLSYHLVCVYVCIAYSIFCRCMLHINKLCLNCILDLPSTRHNGMFSSQQFSVKIFNG